MHDKTELFVLYIRFRMHVDCVLRYPNNARGRQGLDLLMKYINSKTGQTKVAEMVILINTKNEHMLFFLSRIY